MGLQVWLPLNGNIDNQGLSNYQATNTNAIINTNGKIGKCYQFGPNQSYLELPKECMRNLSTECTVSFWIKFITRNSNYETYFQAGLGGAAWNDYVFGLLRNNNGNSCCFTISNGSSASNASYTTPNLTELNTWYHITLVYKTGHCLVYINGELYQDYTTTIIPAFDKITTITIGCSNNKTADQTNCLINDFRIYDTALSPREIKEISRGLVLHYPLSGSGGGCENIMKGSNFSITSGQNTSAVKIATLIPVGTTITVSVQVDADDVVWDSSSNYQRVGIEFWVPKSGTTGNQYLGAWAGQELSSSGNVVEAFTGSFHGRISKTFTTLGEVPELRYVGLYVQGVTSGTVRVSNPKAEIGSIATPWIPNAADTEYATMGFNDGIEYDVSGYGHNGIKTGTFAYDADTPRYNTSTCFNLTDTRITPPIIFQSDAKIPEISFSFWMKRNDYTDAKNHYIYNDICQIYTYSDYLLRISWKHDTESSSTGNTSASSSAITTPNEWHHICYTFDKGYLRLYIDGEFKYGSDRTGTGQFMGSYNFGSIGYASGSNISYGGCLSDFRIYATALTYDQIKDLYHTPISLANNGTLLTQGEYVES